MIELKKYLTIINKSDMLYHIAKPSKTKNLKDFVFHKKELSLHRIK